MQNKHTHTKAHLQNEQWIPIGTQHTQYITNASVPDGVTHRIRVSKFLHMSGKLPNVSVKIHCVELDVNLLKKGFLDISYIHPIPDMGFQTGEGPFKRTFLGYICFGSPEEVEFSSQIMTKNWLVWVDASISVEKKLIKYK